MNLFFFFNGALRLDVAVDEVVDDVVALLVLFLPLSISSLSRISSLRLEFSLLIPFSFLLLTIGALGMRSSSSGRGKAAAAAAGAAEWVVSVDLLVLCDFLDLDDCAFDASLRAGEGWTDDAVDVDLRLGNGGVENA